MPRSRPGSPDGSVVGGAGAATDHSIDGLVVTVDEGVLRLTIDRPATRNALDDDIVAALIDRIAGSATDEGVRAILLDSTGRDFCSGFDIVARNAPGGGRPRVGSIQRRMPLQANRLIPTMLTTQVPIVCAVRGWAAGIGLAMALAADVTVCADDARFWAPFVGRGFTPDSGCTWMLPRRVGEVRARDMLLLGTVVDGRTAVDWGLVHAAVPADELDETVAATVARLATGPTVALGLTKSLLHHGRSLDLADALREESFAMELSSRSEDFKEGFAAFREKREPRFGGR